MLACARIGATHSVVFGGFSAEALRDRMNDAQAKAVITADGGYRRGAVVPLKANVDAALAGVPVGHERARRAAHRASRSPMHDGPRPLVARVDGRRVRRLPAPSRSTPSTRSSSSTRAAPPASRRASCTRPAATCCGAALTHAVRLRPQGRRHLLVHRRHRLGHRPQLRRLRPARERRDDAHVRGRAQPSRSPTASGDLIERHRVTIFYTAPTAIRAFMQVGRRVAARSTTCRSLRLLGTVGEPINPEAWMWYRRVIGGERCPIVDTWWQTETGAHHDHAAARRDAHQARLRHAAVLRHRRRGRGPATASAVGAGRRAATSSSRKPWPSMLRTRLRRPRALRRAVLERSPRASTSPATARGATRTATSGSWAASTTSSTSPATASARWRSRARSCRHPTVAEAAVVGRPDELKGQALVAFVTLQAGQQADDALQDGAARSTSCKEIGAIARPDDIRFTDALPKTRSGKIMRRLLRDIAAGKETLGDTTTLEDFSVLARLREDEE